MFLSSTPRACGACSPYRSEVSHVKTMTAAARAMPKAEPITIHCAHAKQRPPVPLSLAGARHGVISAAGIPFHFLSTEAELRMAEGELSAGDE
jgi:hypothetical protein